MAEKRMFAKTIVLSDAFLDMPLSARCLYFTLGMLADDDGFINNPKSVMRQCGASEDDMKVLLAKSFLLSFESGVIVIKHWRINNYLRNDRYNETKYFEEKEQLSIEENGAYTFGIPSNGIPRLDKNSIDKNSIDNIYTETPRQSFKKPTVEEIKAYCEERKNNINAEHFFDFYESKDWKIGKNKMKDWKACVRTWERNQKSNGGFQKRGGAFDVACNHIDSQHDYSKDAGVVLENGELGF